MIQKHDCYSANCNGCKETYEGYNDFSIFLEKSDLIEEMEMSDWFVDDDECYCPSCAEEKRASLESEESTAHLTTNQTCHVSHLLPGRA
jgi:hypothetical protein